MFDNDNLQDRLDFIVEMMMDDCQTILDTNREAGIEQQDTDDCSGVYHGNAEVQQTIANALIDPRLRNGFLAHWTDQAIIETAEAVDSPFPAHMLAQAASFARKKTAMYLGILEHALEHHGGMTAEATSALHTTVATLALLDGAWETALIAYITAVDKNDKNEFAHSMLQNCLVLKEKASTLIKDAFQKHSIEDLLAGSSLL